MQLSMRTRFYLNNLAFPLLLAVLVFVLFDLTELDRWISNLLLDANGQFVFAHNALFEKLTHKWPRILPDWTGELAVIGVLLSLLWPLASRSARATGLLEAVRITPVMRWSTHYRRDLWFVVVAFGLCTMVIHYLKSHTGVYCPVETTLYGGTEARYEWFDQFNGLDRAGPGRCWPGGHASSGFTLLALYFIALRHRWVHARKLLVAIPAGGHVLRHHPGAAGLALHVTYLLGRHFRLADQLEHRAAVLWPPGLAGSAAGKAQ